MRRIILVLICQVLCLMWADVKIEKVFQSSNTVEYNQWVAKHQKDLPCLKPILVDIDAYDIKDASDTLNVEHKIYYYSKIGMEIEKEIIRERDVYFYIPKTMDRIFITKSRYKEGVESRMIKNSRGETVLIPQNYIAYIGMGIYIESDIAESIPREAEVKIYNETGAEIGAINHLAGVDASQLSLACDERYAVFRGIIANESPVVCINNTGRVVWRKEFDPPATQIFTSLNGTRIGVHHWNLVSILDEEGNVIITINPFGEEPVIKCSLAPSGNFLVISNISKYPKIIFYSALTGEVLWSEDSLLQKNNDVVKYLHIDNDSRTIVLCESHNLYIFNRNGKLECKMNLDLGKEWHSVLAERKEGIIYSRKVEAIARNWYTELHGQYLIVTQGRGSINDIYRKVRQRIVYQILTIK
jgi:hypothetical protein